MSELAIAYLRVSGKGQIDGDGFPRQRTAIQAYADAHNVTVLHWYEEGGVCGANELDDRPALQEALALLQSGEARVVLIEKLDRLARDLMVQESIFADFKRKGFEIRSVLEPDLCKDDPTRVLIRQILGSFAEYERKMIVSKLACARKRVRESQGRCEGRKRFGHHPGEQAVLERMRVLKAEGLSLTAVSRQLNSEGLRTRAGTSWVPASVARILHR